jgi:hypothetical protein
MTPAKKKVCVIKKGDRWIRVITTGKCPAGTKR